MNFRLTSIDLKAAADYLYWQDVSAEIEARLKDPSSTQVMRRQMGRIQSFPNVLARLTMNFEKLILPSEVKFDALWGLIYLNLKACKRLYQDGPLLMESDVLYVSRQAQTYM
jgi:hypothetical protein